MRSSIFALAAVVTALLSACDAGSAKPPAGPASSAASVADPYEATAAAAKGFASGSLVAARTVYVYFDAQCPHCGHLWESMKALNGSMKVVWVPVGLLNPASVSQGAALLAAADPVKAMNDHEAQLAQDHRGMSAPSPSDSQREVIQANTKLLMAVGGDSVPFIVAKNAKTGAVVKQAGALSEPALRDLLGLNP